MRIEKSGNEFEIHDNSTDDQELVFLSLSDNRSSDEKASSPKVNEVLVSIIKGEAQFMVGRDASAGPTFSEGSTTNLHFGDHTGNIHFKTYPGDTILKFKVVGN